MKRLSAALQLTVLLLVLPCVCTGFAVPPLTPPHIQKAHKVRPKQQRHNHEKEYHPLCVVSGGAIPIPSWGVTGGGDGPSHLDQHLHSLAHKFRLQVSDWEERTRYGLESKDPAYGVEVVHADIGMKGDEDATHRLGLELMELAHGSDGQGLVLISGVSGNAASSDEGNNGRIQVGDTITGVSVPGTSFRESTVALDYDHTMDILERAKRHALGSGDGNANMIRLQVNRLVKRGKVQVTVEAAHSPAVTLSALAGENLRQILLRFGSSTSSDSGPFKLYDPQTKRFDMPHATGDCAGDGLCGTCLVRVLQGHEHLSPATEMERLVTKGRPQSWRAACQTVVGHDNQDSANIRIQLHPQSNHETELDPGVRDIHL